jgi:DNA polymerase I-like protein with 3'-5' exonuclease and polymerase domains
MAKLNIQGMSRRNAEQQRCVVADEGWVFVSSDQSAGEPTVTAHYSKDPNYLAATLYMVGKRPFYDKKGMLVIDDIYLMVASRFPKWSQAIKDAFEDIYDGETGFDLWLTDPEHLQKKVLKSIRTQAKVICLALAYGMGVNKMRLIAQQNGFDLTKAEASSFKDLYWSTFPYVKALGDKLIVQNRSLGWIQNDFGYCLYPTKDHKVLNALIQSTVSGIMDLFTAIYFDKYPAALPVATIHDEILFMVREADLEAAKKAFDDSVYELNQTLGWSVPIRFGWETSKTFDLGK